MGNVYDKPSSMIGRVIAFRGDNEVATILPALIDVTETGSGQVEISFDVGAMRVYAAFDLADLRVVVARMVERE